MSDRRHHVFTPNCFFDENLHRSRNRRKERFFGCLQNILINQKDWTCVTKSIFLSKIFGTKNPTVSAQFRIELIGLATTVVSLEFLKNTKFGSLNIYQFLPISASVYSGMNFFEKLYKQNVYFSGTGEIDGCGCSMGDENECEGGYLCNCDASDLGDVGSITNKAALPIQSLSATDVNSQS